MLTERKPSVGSILEELSDRRSHRLSPLVDARSAEIGSLDDAAKASAGVRVLGDEFEFGIPDGEISIEPDVDRALPAEPGDSRRRMTHPLNQLVQRIAACARLGPRRRQAGSER